MKLKTKDLLSLQELDRKELHHVIDLGIKLKSKRGTNKLLLKNKTLAMIFQKPSTRTRVSFETGMFQLGGHAINLSISDIQLSRGESIEDTARTLSRYVDFVMARVYEHEIVENLAKNSLIPVINGLSNSFHPCQILADFMTIKERKKKFDGLKISWVGDCSNVFNSLIYGCTKLGISLSIATPKVYGPTKNIIAESKKKIDIQIFSDPLKAVKDADVIMTDTFVSIHHNHNRIKKFLPKFQVNSSLMKNGKKDAIFLHCLPAKRGSEVTKSVIDGPQSAVWDEAENRLHTQKALLLSLK